MLTPGSGQLATRVRTRRPRGGNGAAVLRTKKAGNSMQKRCLWCAPKLWGYMQGKQGKEGKQERQAGKQAGGQDRVNRAGEAHAVGDLSSCSLSRIGPVWIGLCWAVVSETMQSGQAR